MSQAMHPILSLGLMSGTSADGVDVALLRTDGILKMEFLEAATAAYPSSLRRDLMAAAQSDIPLIDVLSLERRLTEAHVDACRTLLKQANRDVADVDVIGFHGHTIRHDADQGVTWQLGDAAFLAEKIQVRVVHDFRRADMAAGGQGAPLAPLFHLHLLQAVQRPAVVLNLGGVANITWLGTDGKICAGDTGPGCGLLDAWTEKMIGKAYDEDGQLAAKGRVNDALVRSVLTHDFFQRPLPKSADRYEFGFVDVGQFGAGDGAATLCAITVEAVACAIQQLPERPSHCWVTGGGAKHPVMINMLRARLGHAESIESLGFRADHLEAQCFAWLAVRWLRGLPTSLPETTGCQRPTCGGSLAEPPAL